jgi:hypothetical protein
MLLSVSKQSPHPTPPHSRTTHPVDPPTHLLPSTLPPSHSLTHSLTHLPPSHPLTHSLTDALIESPLASRRPRPGTLTLTSAATSSATTRGRFILLVSKECSCGQGLTSVGYREFRAAAKRCVDCHSAAHFDLDERPRPHAVPWWSQWRAGCMARAGPSEKWDRALAVSRPKAERRNRETVVRLPDLSHAGPKET